MGFSISLVILFLVALFLSLAATPLVQALAIKINALDLPGERKLHLLPIPRLGGIAIYLAFVVSLNLGLLFSDSILTLFEKDLRVWLGLFFGGSVVLALGIVDDIYQLRAYVKLMLQLLAALIVYASGLQITEVANPFDSVLRLGWLALPVTVLWIVGITNAMNLIDGLDGLASGIAFIITATILSISLSLEHLSIAVVSAILCGSTLGFLRYNFNPARIFMGDSGSMFLGFTLAAISLQGTQKSTTAVAIFIPILFFGLPIADTALALWRRLFIVRQEPATRAGWRVFQADRRHIHHRLLELGLSQRAAVLTLYVITAGFSALAFVLTAFRNETTAWVLLVTVVVTFVLLVAFAGKGARFHPTDPPADRKL